MKFGYRRNDLVANLAAIFFHSFGNPCIYIIYNIVYLPSVIPTIYIPVIYFNDMQYLIYVHAFNMIHNVRVSEIVPSERTSRHLEDIEKGNMLIVLR